MKLSDEDKEELIGAEKLEKLKALKESMKDMSEEELAQAKAQAEKAQAMEQMQMQEIQGNLEKLTLEREQLKVKIIELK